MWNINSPICVEWCAVFHFKIEITAILLSQLFFFHVFAFLWEHIFNRLLMIIQIQIHSCLYFCWFSEFWIREVAVLIEWFIPRPAMLAGCLAHSFCLTSRSKARRTTSEVRFVQCFSPYPQWHRFAPPPQWVSVHSERQAAFGTYARRRRFALPPRTSATPTTTPTNHKQIWRPHLRTNYCSG